MKADIWPGWYSCSDS